MDIGAAEQSHDREPMPDIAIEDGQLRVVGAMDMVDMAAPSVVAPIEHRGYAYA